MSVVEPQGDCQSHGDVFFSQAAGRIGATSELFSHTIEKLGRTLEP